MAEIDVSNVQDFTPEELLKLMNNAIAHIAAGGQSYTIAGETWTQADLNTLFRRRAMLKREVDKQNGGDIAAVEFRD